VSDKIRWRGKMANEKKQNGELSKREIRRKRRIRNQILSYAVLVILLGGLAFGGYKGVVFIYQKFVQANQPVVVSSNEVAVSDDAAGVIATPEETDEVSDNLAASENEVNTGVNPAVTAYVESMTLEQKVAAMFIVSPESITGVTTATRAGDGTRTALAAYEVGGIVYTGNNITGSDQFKEMVQTTKDMYMELYQVELWTVVQEEGATNVIAGSQAGVVAQSAAADLGTSGDTNNAYMAYSSIGSYLNEYGIDVNLGPVCDVATNADGYLQERSFNSDADIVTSMIRLAVDGQKEQGVITCLTAFPGQGESEVNPLNGTATTERTLEDMRACEFLPFMAGIEEGAQMIMVSHIVASNASGEAISSSLSSVMITDVLRGELGFNGIVITDYMDKKAITDSYGAGEAAVLAIQAGADMILRPANFEEAYQAVLDAVNSGTISEERIDESLIRIYSLKMQ